MSAILNYLFNFKSFNNSRQGWVDVVKGFAIILVVYRHILIGIERADIVIDPLYLSINEMVYSFRMPLFFVLSGFFLAKSISKRGLIVLIVQKASNLLYPYILWCIIIITLQILSKGIINADRSFIDYTYILTSPRAIDQMWFLFALFNVTVLYSFVKEKISNNALVLLIIGLVFHGLSTIDYDLGPFYDLFYYFLFFFIGDFLAVYFLDADFVRKFKSVMVTMILLPLFILSQWYWISYQNLNVYLFMVVSLVGTFFSINLSMIMERTRIGDFFRWVGVHSLSVYILHPSIGAVVRILFIKLGIVNGPFILIVGIFLSTIASIVFYNITQNIGWHFLFKYPKMQFVHKPRIN